MSVIKKYYDEAIVKEPLLDRAFLALEDGDAKAAGGFIERVLDKEPRSVFAYLCKVCAAFGLKSPMELATFIGEFAANADYQKALRFSDGELHDALDSLASSRASNAELYDGAVKTLARAKDDDGIAEAYGTFVALGDFNDSAKIAKSIRAATALIAYYRESYEENRERFAAEAAVRIEDAERERTAARSSLAELEKSIAAQKKELAEINVLLNKLTADYQSVGIFFRERKRLAIRKQADEATAKKGKLTTALNSDKRRATKLKSQIKQCDEIIARGATPFPDLTVHSEAEATKGLPEANGGSGSGESELFNSSLANEKLLTDVSVLRTVLKDKAALFCILSNDKTFEQISKKKNTAACIGAAPAIGEIAPYVAQRLLHPNIYDGLSAKTLKAALAATVKVGGTVTLGSWREEDSEAEPVEWHVARSDGNRYLLVATEPVTSCQFHYEVATRCWAECSLRSYMNGEMLNKLFAWNERDLVTPVTNSDGKYTSQDMLFIPSYEEMLQAGAGGRCNGAWLREAIGFRHQGPDGGYIPMDYYYVSIFSTEGKRSTDRGYNPGSVVPAMWIGLDQ